MTLPGIEPATFRIVAQHLNHCATAVPQGKAVPLQAWSGPEGSRKLRFPDFVTTAQDGGRVVGLTHRPPLPPGNSPGTHLCYRLSQPQGHSAIGRIMSMKNSMTPSGIEPATFQFVAQHHNHCATAVSYIYIYIYIYIYMCIVIPRIALQVFQRR